MFEWILIAIIAALVFKGNRLMELIKTFRIAKEEFKKGKEGIEEEVICDGKPKIKVVKRK
ncbi:twin-arginine translocase TatA/TatE family subunit [Desulfurobacterium atlanticum]|uniref:Sec-independent protein translocase protein TatA n=1 Tax=Desulfurobacterium atlanticum TaxID=240169 RepID=A0A238ZSG5_9BACT|nr:twin-arginine translocase TatA/TatE family subunit [Desulfurobacterium atlanticum]SNR86255.1 sec-independent protein translocase protein TatA [Desulfurobacterium atlanticum]